MTPPQQSSSSTERREVDPALMAILANRFDAIVREMTSTLLRAGRSAVINVARDFSCSIVTADDQLLSAAEGIPIHVFGSHLQTAEMRRIHGDDIEEGDAFLDNDPYGANTHHADHTILVPVFHREKHVFTTVAKAHMADLGNSQPTQYMPFATDIYEEGALNFPCVRIQRQGKDVDDIIRMCRRRIRVPDQWYGDYLATLGAARTAQRRIEEVIDKYSLELVEDFTDKWFAYSERMMDEAIGEIPSGTYSQSGFHDSFGPYDPIPLSSSVTVDSERRRITVDLTDNPDALVAGLNLSRATASSAAITGVLNNLDPEIPRNAGAFRRIDVELRENCVAGIPRHPTSCSVATTNVADRIVNITGMALADAGEQFGIAEGGTGMGIGYAVISGEDWRNGEPYVNQIIIGNNGGPAVHGNDGWLTYTLPVTSGHVYRDSVEIDEQKYPLIYESLRLIPDSGGAGTFRGAPAVKVVYGVRGNPMTLIWAGDGHETPSRGVHAGGSGGRRGMALRDENGVESPLDPLGEIVLQPGQVAIGIDCGGGGFGDPLLRDPERVLHDVLERWVSIEAARSAYGVVFSGDADDQTLAVDSQATEALRLELAARRSS